jgi:hypothetical protein
MHGENIRCLHQGTYKTHKWILWVIRATSDAFVQSRRASIIFVISVRLCSFYQRGSDWTYFRLIWYWGRLWKYVLKIQFFNLAKICGILHKDLSTSCCCRRHKSALWVNFFFQDARQNRAVTWYIYFLSSLLFKMVLLNVTTRLSRVGLYSIMYEV